MTKRKGVFLVMVIFLTAAIPAHLLAYVMGSSSYRLDSDSVNFGGNESASPSYNIGDTIGEIGTGVSTSTNYSLNAGYRQMQGSYIGISLEQHGFSSVNGLFGGSSNASTSVGVVTDSASGYALYVKANSSPAMTGSLGASFADYTPSGGSPDFSFTVPTTESRFGFSPEGADIVQRFKDNGSICNTGGADAADSCWDGLTTTNAMVSQGATANHPTGATTTVKFRAEIGSSKIQDSGSYSSTVIYTAVTL